MSTVIGVILTGGQPRRVAERNVSLEPMAALLQDSGIERIVVSGRYPGFECIPDEGARGGDLANILSVANYLGREGADGKGLLVVPLEMPRLTRDLVRQLAAEKGPCAYFQGHDLPAMLRLGVRLRFVAGELLAHSNRTKRSVRGLLERLEASALPWNARAVPAAGVDVQEAG